MTGIAECWQGVVQKQVTVELGGDLGNSTGRGVSGCRGLTQPMVLLVSQVQRFLEVSWNNTDLVPRFCSLYLELRQAMEELFGQQTLFLLSLRQGFCEGLLQLSFLTALHITEQFARYIDCRIQEISTDYYNLQALGHLQQFLEFVLFLSDLELANSFEHFYRHYLADRLLSLGPSWLESSVVDHIGICFPNRFPQQMLKNLQEASDLQREQHLFCLQEMDTGLLSDEEGEFGGHIMGAPTVPLQDMEEEKSIGVGHLGEEPKVHISVLSPRCWAIPSLCYMKDPTKYFPESLCRPLNCFKDFYTKSQSLQGSDLTQSRRLQWTWLGNAEVQYGSLTLQVSTLQMFILLQFNQREEVSFESITQATGLSQVLIGHALSPLTAKGAILTQEEGECLTIVLHVTRSEPGAGRVLRLLPRQTYLNVEEDEGRTLERKRNVIFCLITQIMKEEKELHIDNLVFRVTEPPSGLCVSLKFLSFGCSHTDVLSCIMHLISQGYVRRSDDRPHILEYLSKDPATPHKGKAHISFQSPGRKRQGHGSNQPPPRYVRRHQHGHNGCCVVLATGNQSMCQHGRNIHH
uniref:Cullin family profile domain-containing protein n=1 Tax=Xenopus tropicalis TaxID=8364 RepID=A0A6I8QHH0_XENTR